MGRGEEGRWQRAEFFFIQRREGVEGGWFTMVLSTNIDVIVVAIVGIAIMLSLSLHASCCHHNCTLDHNQDVEMTMVPSTMDDTSQMKLEEMRLG